MTSRSNGKSKNDGKSRSLRDDNKKGSCKNNCNCNYKSRSPSGMTSKKSSRNGKNNSNCYRSGVVRQPLRLGGGA